MKRLVFLLLSAMLMTSVWAAPKNKPAKPAKDNLVLMPLRLGEQDQPLQGAMETALLEGLQQKYQVFTGDKVDQRRKEVFAKESKKGKADCDETRCLQDIAAAFNSELLAVVSVAKQNDGYFLAINIRNLWDDKVIYSKSVPCKGCDAYAVVDKLKELVGPVPIASASASAEPEVLKVTATDPDSITWAEAQKGNTVDDYQVYLDAYPKGKYIAFAKAKLKKLKEAAQAAAEQQEQQLWDSAQQENSEAGYTRYLTAYPNGRFAGFARTRSDKLKADLAYKEEMAKNPIMVRIPSKNYEMGKYEVTQKEWRDIMGNNPSYFTSCGDNCPVEQVSWDDIQVFLQKLNAKTGRQYRLPTEAEWEYACYGESQTEYCGSNDINAVTWYDGNSNSSPQPVGQKQANGYGLYDMSGNVWEWMQDWRDSNQKWRSLRGGSWYDGSKYVRASYSNYFEPTSRFHYGGFRLARTLP